MNQHRYCGNDKKPEIEWQGISFAFFSVVCALQQALAIIRCTLIEKAFPIALRVARALFPPAERPAIVF
jgi:hypothetical protein